MFGRCRTVICGGHHHSPNPLAHGPALHVCAWLGPAGRTSAGRYGDASCRPAPLTYDMNGAGVCSGCSGKTPLPLVVGPSVSPSVVPCMPRAAVVRGHAAAIVGRWPWARAHTRTCNCVVHAHEPPSLCRVVHHTVGHGTRHWRAASHAVVLPHSFSLAPEAPVPVTLVPLLRPHLPGTYY